MVPWSVAVLLLTPPLYAIIPSYSYLHTCRYIYITFRLALLHAAHNDSHTHKMQFFFCSYYKSAATTMPDCSDEKPQINSQYCLSMRANLK